MSGKLNLLQKLGLVLVLASCVLLIGSELMALHNRSAVEKLTAQLRARLPDVTEGDPGNYSDPEMPVLQLDGQDFSALIQVPAFGVSLPVGSSWDAGRISQYPCRFWGSVYDNSLIVGGSSREGQFDFCGRLDLGYKILVTDMTGARFSYEVIRIDRRSHADPETLGEADCDLILFARDSGTLDYIIVRCTFASGA